MDAVLYVHGKGGSAKESEHFVALFGNCEVIGLDYKLVLPWEVKQEIFNKVKNLKTKYKNIILIANSIGAYYCMNSGIDEYVQKAYFISPIVDMEKLICDMMTWLNVAEKELEDKKIIHTEFGEDLSWDYLTYVRQNPIKWKTPTQILYGQKDDLTDIKTITNFAKTNNFELTIMPDGEHWFHTQEQMKFLDNWIKNS